MGLMRLAAQQRETVVETYRRLIPQRAFEAVQQMDLIGDDVSAGAEGRAFRIITQPTHEAHLRVPARRVGGDFAFSLDLEEAGAGQLRLSFIVINDLAAPRYDIDVDAAGNLTLLGTAGRNLDAELAAMHAGLGPCQVRKGLRMFAELLPRLESFAQQHGYVAIVLEPLTYHNAVMYENYGFAYVRGHKRMQMIDAAFSPGGALHQAMDGSTPFRQPQAAGDARGRSWAIHDGVLEHLDGDTHLNMEMVKVVGQMAKQHTFTGTW